MTAATSCSSGLGGRQSKYCSEEIHGVKAHISVEAGSIFVVAFDSFRKKLLFLQSCTRLGWEHTGFILMCVLTIKTLLANYPVQSEYACVGNLLA